MQVVELWLPKKLQPSRAFHASVPFQQVFPQSPHIQISQNMFQEALFLYKHKCAEFKQFWEFAMHTLKVQRNLAVNKSV